VTRCDEFATSATNVTANESNATQNEVAVMNGVAIIPIVRELLCKGEELGSLHLSLSVALARDVTSCGVLESDEPEIRAPEDRTDGVREADRNSDEKGGQAHANRR